MSLSSAVKMPGSKLLLVLALVALQVGVVIWLKAENAAVRESLSYAQAEADKFERAYNNSEEQYIELRDECAKAALLAQEASCQQEVMAVRREVTQQCAYWANHPGMPR